MNWIFVAALLIALVFFVFNYRNFKGRFFYVFLIALILLFTFSVSYLHSNYGINFLTFEGLVKAGQIYFSWLSSFIKNLGNIAGYVVKQDWALNVTNKTR